jgi:2-oxo-3-(phosphooxy)propyl 3-oxoalkanoate synthase
MTVALSTVSPTLGFEARVPSPEVHKRAVEEVLLTDAAAAGHEGFFCAAQLPRSHRTYVPNGGRHHDLLLLLEVVRQATILAGHRYLDIPTDRQFLLRNVELAIDDLDACRRRAVPAHAIVRLVAGNIRHLDGVVASFELRGWVSIDGRPAASGMGTCLCLASDDYRALRGTPLQASPAGFTPPATGGRAHPAEVGRMDDGEVVVSEIMRPAPGAAQAEVVVDPAHPAFFDHPLDHVPATLLLEAGRQLARATLSAEADAITVACRAQFLAFAELQPPVTCRARLHHASHVLEREPVRVEVAVEQERSAIAQLSFDLCGSDA